MTTAKRSLERLVGDAKKNEKRIEEAMKNDLGVPCSLEEFLYLLKSGGVPYSINHRLPKSLLLDLGEAPKVIYESRVFYKEYGFIYLSKRAIKQLNKYKKYIVRSSG